MSESATDPTDLTDPPTDPAWLQRIYHALDQKLRASAWGNGAAEAHGLSTALVCGGVTEQTLPSQAELFQLAQPEFAMIEGLFGLAMRELAREDFAFNLLLPDDSVDLRCRTDALRQWCQGFILGIGHQQTQWLADASPDCLEALSDIQMVSALESPVESGGDTGGDAGSDTGGDAGSKTDAATEQALFRIQEHVRVAVQLIYYEFVASTRRSARQTRH